MNILSLENITKAYGERKLFDHASFYLQEGEKVGMIGINGTGKSTLLKMMAGEESPDQGTVTRAGHVVCSFLPQHPVFDPQESILQAVVERSGGMMSREHLETEAKTMLTRLGITDFDSRCGILSGGQRKRLALVAALLSSAEILILDEPTNHLDHEMADWLEEQLKRRKGAVVMVTHDRYFLDSVTERIVEIDKGQMYSYQAGYSGYLELKAAREESELASERKRQSILRTELEWVRRGARARSTKQKARLERYQELKDAKAPEADGRVEMESAAARLGKTTVELSHIAKAYGDKKLIDDFSYIFLKNDRIGFVGANGCGKTTLMKIIAGLAEPDAGDVLRGQTVKIGYYAQEIGEDEMPPGMRVIDYIREVAEYVSTKDGLVTASRMLENFLFEGKDQYGLLGKLSGGEKRRLHLLKVLMGAPNVLILDEPTNDFDITTLTVLEDYLDSFQGIVITVSHDRYFLDRTVKRIFAFEGEGVIRQYEGGYTDYRLRLEEEAPKQQAVPADKAGEKKNTWRQSETRLKFSYKEQREYETIEDEIAVLEEKLETLEQEILKAATDFVRLNELTEEKSRVQCTLDEKMERWMYLEERKAEIDRQQNGGV